MGKKSKNLLYYSIFFRTVVAIIKRYKYDSISLSKTDKRNCLYYALKSKNALQTNMRGKMIQIVCKTEQYRTEQRRGQSFRWQLQTTSHTADRTVQYAVIYKIMQHGTDLTTEQKLIAHDANTYDAISSLNQQNFTDKLRTLLQFIQKVTLIDCADHCQFLQRYCGLCDCQ